MKILTNLTASGGLDLGSSNKDTFTIGTPLENNDGNVDNLYVYANADFKNNVILGSSSVDNITVSGNLIIKPVATPPTPQEGQIYYDSAKHELVYNSEVSTVLNSLGRSLLVRAKNTDSVTLTKGMAVRVGTPQGANKTFARALSVNVPLTGAAGNQIIGVINADIAVNDFGYATTFGEITNLNTNAFTEGNEIYVSNTTSGSLTGSRPTAPYEVIPIGTCIYQHPTQGKIFVKTRDPSHFGDITGFNPDTTALLDGQVIRYRSSDGTWGNSNTGVKLTGSFSGSLHADQITASAGVLIQNSSLYITGSGSTIYLNGQDITQGGGGGGGGGGSAVNYYLYTLVTSSTFTIDEFEEYEIVYCDPTPVSGNITITLPDASSDNVVNRKFTIKHIGNSDLVIVSASNSQNIEGYSGVQIYGKNSAPSASVVTVHAMKDTRDNSFKWYRINYVYS
jgi:hypothetical protein